jgi:hypothetical protein
MNAETLASKYISSAEEVLQRLKLEEMQTTVEFSLVRQVIDACVDYLRDAKYFREEGKFNISLTSVAYCEGLLDALRMLGVVKFEWPTKKDHREKIKE